MRRLPLILIIPLLTAVIWSQAGCSTVSQKPRRKTIQGVFDHFKASGLKVDKVEDVLFQAVRASDGIIMYIDGAKVEIYDYNTAIPVQKRHLEQVEKTEKLTVLTIPVSAVVNCNLVMLTYSQHPKMREIINAFKSF